VEDEIMRQSMLHLAMFLVAACLLTGVARAGELVLADGGRTDYRIVLADDASPRPSISAPWATRAT
jgi:hypothetical protein